MLKQDMGVGAIIGFVAGFFLIFIARNIEVDKKIPFLAAVPFLLAVLSLAGIAFTSWIGKRFPVFLQVARFGLAGVLSAMIDLGVLNFLIFVFSVAEGPYFSMFKVISFLVSATNSYFWNKLWTFKSVNAPKPVEFARFAVIASVGFVINVSVASFLVNVIGAPSGVSQKIWANVGAILAGLTAMTWTFIGYKFIVFKSKKNTIII